MTLEEYEGLIDAYGPEMSSWPRGQQIEAAAFAKSSIEAQRYLAEARALDRLMDQVPAGDVTAALTKSILASAPSADRHEVTAQAKQGWADYLVNLADIAWPQFGWVRPAGLMTATMALGFYLGFAGSPEIGPVEEDDMFASVFSIPDASDWDAGGSQ